MLAFIFKSNWSIWSTPKFVLRLFFFLVQQYHCFNVIKVYAAWKFGHPVCELWGGTTRRGDKCALACLLDYPPTFVWVQSRVHNDKGRRVDWALQNVIQKTKRPPRSWLYCCLLDWMQEKESSQHRATFSTPCLSLLASQKLIKWLSNFLHDESLHLKMGHINTHLRWWRNESFPGPSLLWLLLLEL